LVKPCGHVETHDHFYQHIVHGCVLPIMLSLNMPDRNPKRESTM